MNTDSITAADGMRLTVSQVTRLCQSHGLTTDETQDVFTWAEGYEDGTFDAQDVLRQLGY